MTITASTPPSAPATPAAAPARLPSPPYDHIDDEQCRAFQSRIEIVGRKWNSGILLAAVRGAERFSEYRAMIDGISDRLLSQRLRELETEGLIVRSVVPTTPVQVRYRPTDRARSMMQAMQPIVQWAYLDEHGAYQK